jgi:cytochrome c-type biogenesis protein CcmE
MTKQWKILLTAFAVVLGGGFLVYSAVANTRHYFPVDELLAEDLATWDHKSLQVSGHVQPGSIVDRPSGNERDVSFVIEDKGKRVRVFFHGLTPDTFNDTAQAVVIGKLVPSAEVAERATALHVALADTKYVIVATELSAKCPSKYEGAPSNKTTFK